MFGESFAIPCGWLDYVPDSWKNDTNNFSKCWDKDTGNWRFQSSLKNYDGEIEAFLDDLLPYFIETIEYLELYHEDDIDEFSKKYELIDGEVLCVERHDYSE